jgi:hypothetical protein
MPQPFWLIEAVLERRVHFINLIAPLNLSGFVESMEKLAIMPLQPALRPVCQGTIA